MDGHADTITWAANEASQALSALPFSGLPETVSTQTKEAIERVRSALSGASRYFELELTSQDPADVYQAVSAIVSDSTIFMLELVDTTPPAGLTMKKNRTDLVTCSRLLRDVLQNHRTAREQLDVRRGSGASLGTDLDHLHRSFVAVCDHYARFCKHAEATLDGLAAAGSVPRPA